ncbi:MAG TPA: preprotein translocase subunit SecG [candidate division Zixibacteria bacterium]
MYSLVIVLYLIVCIAMVISILLQSSKGDGLAGAFGGSSMTGTVFGGRGAATFLSKATSILGASFMVLAIALAFLHPATGTSSQAGSSAVEEAVQKGEVPLAPPVQQAQPPAGQQPGADGQQNVPIEQLFESGEPAEGQPAQTEGQTPPPQPEEQPAQQPEQQSGDDETQP